MYYVYGPQAYYYYYYMEDFSRGGNLQIHLLGSFCLQSTTQPLEALK